jgi:hypothetical protein
VGGDRVAPCSLEDLVAHTDLLAYSSVNREILSQKGDYCKFLGLLEARGREDSSYAGKLREEAQRMALPALVAWEALSIACEAWGPATPPKTTPLVTLLDVLLDRSSRLTLATLNYDLVLEKAAMQLLDTGRTFRYGEACETTPPTVEVLKLHGSLNWKEDTCFGLRPDVPDWGENSWLEVVRPRFSASGFVQPSLLLPTLFKQEININYQTDPRARHYKTLWEVFAVRLASATALLTVGCSFSDTDWHLRVMIGSAINAEKLQRIVVCAKGDTGPIDRLKKVVPKIVVRGETDGLEALVEGDKVDWLMQPGVT